MSKKKLFVAALAICLVAVLSVGTLAWFTDSDSVENTFMFAASNADEDDVFSVDIFEMKDTDGDGDGDDRTDYGIVYGGDNDSDEVVPGAELSKEAFVQNTGKFDQYVRVKVTLSDVNEWADVLSVDPQTGPLDLERFFKVPTDFDTTWVRYDAETVYDATASTLTYVYYYNGVLAAGANEVAFLDAVVIPEAMEREDVVAMKGSFKLSFVAEAVQSTNMLDTYGAVEYENAIASFDVID